MTTEENNVPHPGDSPAYAAIGVRVNSNPYKDNTKVFYTGMTIRQHAAIDLRVPDSGLDWLDAMIVKRNRMDIAKAAVREMNIGDHYSHHAEIAFATADAMLAEAGKDNEDGK